MVSLYLDDEEQKRLENFMRHRRLNDAAIKLLVKAKEEFDLKNTEIHTAQSLKYSLITEDLIKAVNSGWLTLDEIVKLLDDSEFSGKQHVLLYKMPDKGAGKILDALRNPAGAIGVSSEITDFISLPTGSTIRIVRDTAEEVAVKIVTRRSYWTSRVIEQNPDRELFERLRHEERAAVIVKANRSNKMVQFRVPPREKGPQQTGKAVYQFLYKSLENHYTLDKNSWFRKLKLFPISDAIPSILANKTDFELWHDTPENKNTRTRMSKRGRPVVGNDLRSEKNWQFSKGYSRTNIRGFWKNGSGKSIYTHMNADRVRVSKTETRDFARLVINELCSDGELDHVVDRICDHL
ncbi:hypothetical protein Pan153_04350 [Gimesia panareensis]|uniref:Uncharacterized protein n=1 Tax=Gimesia panareensis TaxID=2527978 RepID=A0A518FHI5_9PLAN|nr:hypothetical protein [Gimesia panareensis]QDV15816.1 hypothetical protein Pan153_04350 [Gimesia panareensis]